MSDLNLNRAHDSRNHPVPHHYFQHTENAHRIRSDQEAIEIAQRLAERFAQEASQRDQARQLPLNEVQAFRKVASGRLPCQKHLAVLACHIVPWPR